MRVRDAPSCPSPVLWPPSEGSGDVGVNPLGCISNLPSPGSCGGGQLQIHPLSAFQCVSEGMWLECVLVVSQLAAHPRRGVGLRAGRVRSEKTHGLRERVGKSKAKTPQSKTNQGIHSLPWAGGCSAFPRKAGEINVITPKTPASSPSPSFISGTPHGWDVPGDSCPACVPSQLPMLCHLPL